jgi:hypothetical protein
VTGLGLISRGLCCLADADVGHRGYIPWSFAATAPGDVRAAHSSRRDAVSKRIDQLAADVAATAGTRSDQGRASMHLPGVYGGPRVPGQHAAPGPGSTLTRCRCAAPLTREPLCPYGRMLRQAGACPRVARRTATCGRVERGSLKIPGSNP